jgi:hypothetical protein
MTLLSSLRSLHREDSADRTITTTIDVVTVLRRSNHATAFAGWTVATIAMGLVIQIDTVRAIGSGPAVILLAALLVPVLAATGRVVVLLSRAAQAATDAGTGIGGDAGTGVGSDAKTHAGAAADLPSASAAWDRLNILITMTQIRDSLARRALGWAYGSGIAFLAWSVLATILAAGE